MELTYLDLIAYCELMLGCRDVVDVGAIETSKISEDKASFRLGYRSMRS